MIVTRLQQVEPHLHAHFSNQGASRMRPTSVSLHPMLQYQRLLGNQATEQMLMGGEAVGPAGGAKVQARSLSNAARARESSLGRRTSGETHAIAEQGAASEASGLPHMERIQQSFGAEHDLSTVQAHIGERATEANRQMGSQAYTRGEHAVFRKSPSLWTAAHEAAHVIQQRSGVRLHGGVGKHGDSYEQHADAVAERVVQGRSAAPLLDAAPGLSHGGGAGAAPVAVQHEMPEMVELQEDKDKHVSQETLVRLQMAQSAVNMTKSVLKFGAGNQVKALRATKFNSFYRMQLARDPSLWTVDPSVSDYLDTDPLAFKAARAYVAQGGNCGEHSMLTYQFLKKLAKGRQLNRIEVKGVDHAYVLIGDLTLKENGEQKESDAQIAVADAWPTTAVATLWEDHYFYTKDRNSINVMNHTVADGTSSMLTIAAGIKPNAKGEELLKKVKSDEEVESDIGKEGSHFWDQPSGVAKGKEFFYYSEDAMDRRIDLQK